MAADQVGLAKDVRPGWPAAEVRALHVSGDLVGKDLDAPDPVGLRAEPWRETRWALSLGSRSFPAGPCGPDPRRTWRRSARAPQDAFVAVDDGRAAIRAPRLLATTTKRLASRWPVLRRSSRNSAGCGLHGNDQHLGRHVHEPSRRSCPTSVTGHSTRPATLVEQAVVGLQRPPVPSAQSLSPRPPSTESSSCARRDRGLRAPPGAWRHSRRSPTTLIEAAAQGSGDPRVRVAEPDRRPWAPPGRDLAGQPPWPSNKRHDRLQRGRTQVMGAAAPFSSIWARAALSSPLSMDAGQCLGRRPALLLQHGRTRTRPCRCRAFFRLV